MANAFSQGDLANFITDTTNNWQYLLAALGWGVLISFIFMFCLRCLAGCIVWCSIFGLIFFFIGLGLLFLYNAGYLGAASGVATYVGVPSFSGTSANNAVYGWICIGLGCFFFLVTLCCCSRLRLAVAVCKSAGQFVASVCSSVLVPIIQALFAMMLWGGSLVVMVFLVSSTGFVATSGTYFSSIASYEDPSMIRFYVFVFFTLWTSAFIGAMTIFIIASACTMWYYSHGPDS
jgi:solute carrier family 44 (choline transporter-like protein), member 2/4/5